MPGRELRRRYPADRTVRSGFVVITPPLADDHSSVCEIVEVVIVQAFVSKLAVEALDVGVLRGLAGSNQFQIDTLGISQQSSARLVNSGPWSVRIAFGSPRNWPI